MNSKLKIAMIGQKGIPARYGGIETHVENIATRLAGLGHEVWVYCRNRFRPADPRGFAGYEETANGARYRGVNLAFHSSQTKAQVALRWRSSPFPPLTTKPASSLTLLMKPK